MEENLNILKGLIFSQQILMKLTSMGLKRQIAYEMVQRNALKTWETGREFKELLLEDEEIVEYITEDSIEEIFSLDYHFKHVEEIFSRVFR
jgi:adenylosuccinate lyase